VEMYSRSQTNWALISQLVSAALVPQVFLAAFTKQMYLINRETQGAFWRWDSQGTSAQLGSRACGLLLPTIQPVCPAPASGLQPIGWPLSTSTLRQGPGPGLGTGTLFVPHSNWTRPAQGWQGQEKVPPQLRPALWGWARSQPGWGAVCMSQEAAGCGRGGELHSWEQATPTSAQLPPHQAGLS
jgi:hypothetical protein